MNEPWLVSGRAWSCKAGDRDDQIGVRTLKCGGGHQGRNPFRDRAMNCQNLCADPQHLSLRFVAVGDITAFKSVRATVDVGQERGQHPARAALGGCDCKVEIACALQHGVRRGFDSGG
ncbi:MAG: hypothetical protein WAU68_05090 [Vitreimonas sp.]